MTDGYIFCGCRDCFETTIGKPGALCHECEEAECGPNSECSASGAYGTPPEDFQHSPKEGARR